MWAEPHESGTDALTASLFDGTDSTFLRPVKDGQVRMEHLSSLYGILDRLPKTPSELEMLRNYVKTYLWG
jgi:hypothetical protein